MQARPHLQPFVQLSPVPVTSLQAVETAAKLLVSANVARVAAAAATERAEREKGARRRGIGVGGTAITGRDTSHTRARRYAAQGPGDKPADVAA